MKKTMIIQSSACRFGRVEAVFMPMMMRAWNVSVYPDQSMVIRVRMSVAHLIWKKILEKGTIMSIYPVVRTPAKMLDSGGEKEVKEIHK